MLLTFQSFIYFRQLFVGYISIDIDECVGGSHSCSPDAYCNNTKGSYNCTCKPGFLGSGRECEGERYFWEYWAKEYLYSSTTSIDIKKTKTKTSAFWLKNQIAQNKQQSVLQLYLLLFFKLFIYLYVYFFYSFYRFILEISTSVLALYTPAVLMHFAITPKGHTVVPVNMD